MEIHFCDLCNESVPASDLETGRAFLRKGRVVCATCDRAMGGGEGSGAHEALRGGGGSSGGSGGSGGRGGGAGATALAEPPKAALRSLALASAPGGPEAAPLGGLRPGAEAEPGGAGVWLSIVAILFAAGAFALMSTRLDETDARLVRERADGIAREQALEARAQLSLAGIDERLRASEKESAGAMSALQGEMGRRLDGFERELLQMRTQSTELAQDLSDLSRKLALDAKDTTRELERLGAAQQSLVTAMTEWQHSLDQRLIVVEEYQRASLTAAGSGMGSGAGAPGLPTWHGLLPDLKHEHEGLRLEAVYALGETKDPAVVPYLMPLLADPNLFVRMAVIQSLKNLNARVAVPALIDTLEDEDGAVREAAMLALHKLTGREFRFEPEAPVSERSKRVKAWRDWWEKSGEAFLEG